MISEKSKLRKTWQQTRLPQDKTKLNNFSQKLKRSIKQIKNDSINTYLQELTNDSSTDYSLWKTTKNLKTPILQIPLIRQEDGSWAKNNEQKAKIFANHLEKTFKPQGENENTPGWEEPVQENKEIHLTTPKEVSVEIILILKKQLDLT